MAIYNGVILQYFHWYTPDDGMLWKTLAENAAALAGAGFTAIWLPPAGKAADGKAGTGYNLYDPFDLGEFDQKGSVRTKYGTRNEFLTAVKAVRDAGMHAYADVVFNHKLGGDALEELRATPYNPQNRNEPIGKEETIHAWTHFTFPGRGGKYSGMQWRWQHFNAVDHNALDEEKDAVYLFEGKSFETDVDSEKGNFDYLMGCNVDINHPEVRQEFMRWGEWLLETTGVNGFRFDAVKHVKSGFFLEWLAHLKEHGGNRELFVVGEYWSGDVDALTRFIEETGGGMMLFDVALHFNFAVAGREGDGFDMRTIFDNTLVGRHPELAVTMVSNHDSQPLQSLESVVEAWFKPLAYALVLLRRDGYPCVFVADYYGAHYTDTGPDGREHEIWMATHQWLIDKYLHARKNHAYGDQHDYFDHPDRIGWTRTGDEIHPGGMVVIMSNAGDGAKHMKAALANSHYTDLTGHVAEPVVTDGEGWGEFRCKGRAVSVWIVL